MLDILAIGGVPWHPKNPPWIQYTQPWHQGRGRSARLTLSPHPGAKSRQTRLLSLSLITLHEIVHTHTHNTVCALAIAQIAIVPIKLTCMRYFTNSVWVTQFDTLLLFVYNNLLYPWIKLCYNNYKGSLSVWNSVTVLKTCGLSVQLANVYTPWSAVNDVLPRSILTQSRPSPYPYQCPYPGIETAL